MSEITPRKNRKIFDRKGKEIKEFAVIKIFHFIGARGKKHYMYKWVRSVDGFLVGMHLTNAKLDSWFLLWTIANEETGIISDAEIVQQYD